MHNILGEKYFDMVSEVKKILAVFLEFFSNWLRLITLWENVTIFWSCGPDCIYIRGDGVISILQLKYSIYSAIRRGFPYLDWLQITKPVLWNVAVIRLLLFPNSLKDLDPSFKMDLDFWDCFGSKKTPSYNRRNIFKLFSCLIGCISFCYWYLKLPHKHLSENRWLGQFCTLIF